MKTKLISFVLAQTKHSQRGKPEAVALPLKRAPHYYGKAVPPQFIVSQKEVTLGVKTGALALKMYHPDTLLAEAHFELDNPFANGVSDFKERVIALCREELAKAGAKDVEDFSEEYSVFAVSGYAGDPEKILEAKKEKIAGLLKSESLRLAAQEIEYTLSAQLKYGKNDLVIVDWDDAFLFDPDGDFASTVELLELANFQLLKYRLLDAELDKRLRHVADIFHRLPEKKAALFGRKDVRDAVQNIIKIRSVSLFDFEGLERDIKLIGDWYSARLYDLIAKKFKFEEWRRASERKLNALEDTYALVSERFSLSPERLQLIGWFILLIGWGILLAFDLYLKFGW